MFNASNVLDMLGGGVVMNLTTNDVLISEFYYLLREPSQVFPSSSSLNAKLSSLAAATFLPFFLNMRVTFISSYHLSIRVNMYIFLKFQITPLPSEHTRYPRVSGTIKPTSNRI